jgi:hypothetical protein
VERLTELQELSRRVGLESSEEESETSLEEQQDVTALQKWMSGKPGANTPLACSPQKKPGSKKKREMLLPPPNSSSAPYPQGHHAFAQTVVTVSVGNAAGSEDGKKSGSEDKLASPPR